jgi:hypothetical protein
MNRLSPERRAEVISRLIEGMSVSFTAQVTLVAKNTVVKLLTELGAACSQYLDRTLRNLSCQAIACDEIWSFRGASTMNVPAQNEGGFGAGDVWTWTAIDAETKLIPSWLVGRRDELDCYAFLSDLRSRIAHRRLQLTTSGSASYLSTIEPLFSSNRLDHAMLVTAFEGGDYDLSNSALAHTGIEHRVITGNSVPERVPSSHAERRNLMMRIGMRGVTPSTNAFLKKVENHAAAISLHFMFYNFALPHLTLSKAAGPRKRITPAIAAGVANHVWSIGEIAALLD